MFCEPRVILISSNEAEAVLVSNIFTHELSMDRVNSLSELETALDETSYDAVFCGWSLHKSRGYDALGGIKDGIPPVIFLPKVEKSGWAEMLQVGAFQLLSVPVWKEEIVSVLEYGVACEQQQLFERKAA